MARGALIVAVLLGAASPAGAVEPKPAAPAGEAWNPVPYNEALVAVQGDLLADLNTLRTRVPIITSRADHQAYRASLRTAVQQHVDAVRAIPAHPGDEGFHAAVLAVGTWMLGPGQALLDELDAIAFGAEVGDPMIERLDAVYRRISAEAERVDKAVLDRQQAFARTWRMVIQPQELRTALPPDEAFAAPGIPPAGLALRADWFLFAVVGYHNRLLEHHGELIGAVNGWMEAATGDAKAAEAARLHAWTVAQAVRSKADALGPLQGDRSFRAALLALCDTTRSWMEAPAQELIERVALPSPQPADIDRINQLVDAMNDALAKEMEAFGRAHEGFQARWHLGAYQAWSDQRREAGGR